LSEDVWGRVLWGRVVIAPQNFAIFWIVSDSGELPSGKCVLIKPCVCVFFNGFFQESVMESFFLSHSTKEINLRIKQASDLFEIEKQKMIYSRQAAEYEMLLAKKRYEDSCN